MDVDVARRSREHFTSGFYCAESVLLALAEACGTHSEVIPQIATGFCSGISRSGGMCGALSGGIMGIGLFRGRNSPGEPVNEIYAAVRRLLEEFEQRHGATGCRELIGCDLNTDEGQAYFKDNNLIEGCLQYTADAAELALRFAQG